MAKRQLTIVIPTYNRAAMLNCVLFQLAFLRDTDWFDVVILDNASETPIGSIIKNYEGRLHIYYSRNIVNSGCAETNIRRISSIKNMPLNDYVWVLGDDDLPNRDALLIMKDILRETQGRLDILAFGNRPFKAGSIVYGTRREIACMQCTVAEWFEMLIRKSDYASEKGLTFISNVITSSSLFKLAWLDESISQRPFPSNLPVLAAIAENGLDNHSLRFMEADCKLVSVAFKPIAYLASSKILLRGKSQEQHTSTNEDRAFFHVEEHTSNSYLFLRAWTDTFHAIAGNIPFFEQHNGPASEWFFLSCEYYSKIVTAALMEKIGAEMQAEELFKTYELRLFKAYLKRIARRTQSQAVIKCLEQLIELEGQRTSRTSFSDNSYGSSKTFSPILGWV